MNTERVILATLAGVGAGVLIGILVAPDKGEKTRKKLSEKGNGYLKEIKSDFKELKKTANKKISEAKKELKEVGKKGKAKAEEVVDETREKATK